MWIADHPQHRNGAATIGLELVETVPSFYAVLIALGGGRWPPAWVILNEATSLSELLALLTGHKQTQDAERTAERQLWKEGGCVFTKPTGEPLNPNIDDHEWRKLLRATQVWNGRPHDARHTAATAILLLGVPERSRDGRARGHDIERRDCRSAISPHPQVPPERRQRRLGSFSL